MSDGYTESPTRREWRERATRLVNRLLERAGRDDEALTGVEMALMYAAGSLVLIRRGLPEKATTADGDVSHGLEMWRHLTREAVAFADRAKG